MSFTDRLILWLHIGVAIFTIGPVTAAIMSTPRYIRKRDAVVVGYLQRITRVYAVASLLVFVFGLVLADLRNDFSKPWISISMTLFVVALVLLVLIMRDQRTAAAALRREAMAVAPQPPAVVAAKAEGGATAEGEGETAADGEAESARGDAPVPGSGPGTTGEAERIAVAVEGGRIASLGGVTALIWLVILVLMVWK
jgi:hypothetical protein